MSGAARTPVYKKKRDLWRQVIFDTRGDGVPDSIAAQRIGLMTLWHDNPWQYLTAHDVGDDAQAIINTADELDDNHPVKPFPAFRHLKYITEELWSYRIVLIDKVRQMLITTLCMLLIDWYCSFREEREVFVSRVKEELAEKLLNDKIRAVHARKPTWLQLACPISKQPKNIITYLETGSTVTGVAQNFGSSDARGATASLILVDEAAYQELFPSIYRAVLPMAARLWAVTTANIGNPGAALFKQLVFAGRPSAGEIALAAAA